MTENQFRWRMLTAEVADKASPLRQHLDARFPNLRPLQSEYKASASGILVDRGSAHPGTLGAAFDFAVRFALDPGYKADIAVIGFMFDGLQELVGEVVTVAKAAQAFSPRSPELMRACWALALCTEVFRVGLMPGPLAPAPTFAGSRLPPPHADGHDEPQPSLVSHAVGMRVGASEIVNETSQSASVQTLASAAA